MKSFSLVFVVLTTFRCSTALKETPVIQTKLGPVKGEVIEVDGMEIYHFGAIPYAEPMVGDLRYRKTVPKQPWTDVLNVGPPPEQCFQWGYGSEDCLKISIWVKKSIFEDAMNHKNNTSVYSYIHGGGFRGGSIKENTGLVYIAVNYDLVVTAVQYRLGSLGFAYLGTEDVPGNMGLWDQLEGMKWIRDNIEAFGGNSDEITILGESAGGVSVTLHQISPYSRGKGLYRSIIAMSGSALCVWGTHSKDQALKATSIVFDINCPQDAIDEKLKCLRVLDTYNLTLHDKTVQNLSYAGMIFGPVVDGEFLPRHPRVMLLDEEFEKVPMIVSFVKDEGSRFAASPPLGSEYLPTKDHPDRLNYLTYAEYQLFFHERFILLTEPFPTLQETIELQYWPHSHEGYPKGPEVFEAIQQAEGDFAFSCPVFKWGKTVSKYVDKIFAFYYTQRLKNHPYAAEWLGVVHADNVAITCGHMFKPGYKYVTPDELEMSKKVMVYFTNFVKYNDPNGIKVDDSTLRFWPPMVGSNCSGQYFEINTKTLVTDVATTDATICDLKANQCTFWQDFLPKQIEALAGADERRTTPKPPNTAWRQEQPFLALLFFPVLPVLLL